MATREQVFVKYILVLNVTEYNTERQDSSLPQSQILFSFVSAFFDIDFLSRRTAVMLDAVVISTK